MTCIPTRLECDGLDTLDLSTATFGAAVLDLGDAVTRAVAQDAPDADGTIDTTAYVGARNITLTVLVDSDGSDQTMWALVSRLRAFTAPRLRPKLFLQFPGETAEVMATLRRSQFSDVWTPDGTATRKVTVQWVAPLGILESADAVVTIANASGSGAEGGRTYDKTYDFTYSGGSVIGETTVTNGGNTDAWPLLRVYGPCTDPVLRNQTSALELSFTGLTVNAGEFVEIDTRARTIYYNGDPPNGRYSDLDFTASAWWPLVPGDNVIRFTPATYTAPSNLEITYRDAWL